MEDYSHVDKDFIFEQIEGICINYSFFITDKKIKRGFAEELSNSIDDYLFKIKKDDIVSTFEIYRKIKQELGL